MVSVLLHVPRPYEGSRVVQALCCWLMRSVHRNITGPHCTVVCNMNPPSPPRPFMNQLP